MDAQRVRQLFTARAPFMSMYFGDSHDTADAASGSPSGLPIGARRSGYDPDEVQDAIEADGLRRQLAGIQAAVQRFTAESGRGSGVAIEGLAAVRARFKTATR